MTVTELLITYPAGSTAERSTVVAATRTGSHLLFAVERTPCHPESPRWPDQPADRCAVMGPSGSAQTPVECLEGWLCEGELGLGEPPSRSEASESPHALDPVNPHAPEEAPSGLLPAEEPQAIRCVVHRGEELALQPGDEVTLSVDERFRESISRSHSHCHLVSLALNAALADAWRKEPPARDSLGNPDFDKLAILSSRIEEHGSVDIYRIGKHLRKSGFSAEALSEPEALARAVTQIAGGWLQSTLESEVTPGVCRLEEFRTWSCELPTGTASFPCGGTHAKRMGPHESPTMAISWDPQERRLEMTARSGVLVGQSVYD
jgi:alanyl-tRNA synthetase